MSEDAFTPKYLQIVTALRARIAEGRYLVGARLPSETELIREFGVSRPTVVRALQEMELRGEIAREHGRGSFVKAVHEDERGSRPGLAVLDRPEGGGAVRLVQCGPHVSPLGVAQRLGLAESARAHLRRYLSVHDGLASELVSLWTPIEVARASGLDQDGPLTVPVRRLLARGTAERLARVAETLTARWPQDFEAEHLALDAHDPVLAVLASVFDTTGRAVLVAEVVLPGSLHELEDHYAL